MQRDAVEARSDQTPARAAANTGLTGGGISLPASIQMIQAVPPLGIRQEKPAPAIPFGPPVQRVILDDEGEEELDDVIEKAIAHLPEDIQDAIWSIHRSPKYKVTLDDAVEMATAGDMEGPLPHVGDEGDKSSGMDAISLLQEEEAIAETTIELPWMEVTPEQEEEVSRQLALQLENLNRLSAKQWLINILLNRMKTTEQLVQDDYGTGTGKALAAKIDTLLIKNGKLARFFMTELKKRMLLLLVGLGAGDELQKLVGGILDAIDRGLAAEDEEVYLAFRHAKGLEQLAVLQASGVQGGLGRQQGKGDEKSFRKEFEDGIELCKVNFPELAKNAVLHNPDQCAGGPFEILWNGIHEAGLLHARDWYRKILPLYQKKLWLVENYRKEPPTIQGSGEKDERMIEKAEEELIQMEDEMEQAASAYLHEIHVHLGNYDVNSLLGKTWMEALPGQLINRVNILLDHVLQLSLKDLDRTRMHVIMEAVSEEEEAISGESGSFPDVLSAKKLAKPQAPTKKGRKRKTVSEKILAGKEKMKGPQQASLHDMIYRKDKASGEKDKGSKKKEDVVPVMGFLAAVDQDFNVIPINGDGLACYIRSIVTGTPGVADDQIENLVGAISDHLAHIGIRSANQMIDAGGLAAAEVRHALSQLMGHALTPRVEIIIRDPRGGYARFTANEGDYTVILLHTGAHFDLLTEK